MQQQPLNYQPQAVDVRTFRWRWDYSTNEWKASLRASDAEEFKLRRDASGNLVRAEHAQETWSLHRHGSALEARRDADGAAVATVQRREIKFADGTTVRKESGWLTLREQYRFIRGTDVLLTAEKLFWSKSGRRVRVTTTAAGAAFPHRVLLVLLAFLEMIERDMNR